MRNSLAASSLSRSGSKVISCAAVGWGTGDSDGDVFLGSIKPDLYGRSSGKRVILDSDFCTALGDTEKSYLSD